MLPATYKATLNVNGRDVQTIDVAVKGDPEIQITDTDRRLWFDTARDLHQQQQKANEVAEMVQNAYAQVQLIQQQTRTANVSAVHCADYIDVLAGSGQRSRFFGDLRCYGQMAAAYVRESNGTQQPYALTGSLFISSADGWDARASKRTLSAATLYIGVDNTSALVFVHATNKASAGTWPVAWR